MYPRNAASPERIAIGPVVQISDGAVQTSGCTVRIIPFGVAEGDGAGTTAYSTDGIVLYTPTQAETNYTSFVLIAKRTGCIPASVTVVTTASATAGRTMPADGSITDATLAGALEIVFETDFATNYNTTRNAWATNVQDFVGTTASDPFAGKVVAASVTAEVTPTAASKTGYALGATGLDSVTLPANIITAVSIATGAITNAKFASGAIDAAAIANGAIDAATFAADVDAEFLSYIVDDATRIDASSLNTASVTSIPAILADTGTDGVVLANDAITAAKFDESTAFPLAAADTGATYVARSGGTIQTLDALDTAQDVEHDATQAAISAVQTTVNNIANVSAPSYAAPTSYTLTTGNQTSGTYVNVDSLNQVYHVHTDAAGTLSLTYHFTLSPDELASELFWSGRWNGVNDTLLFEIYDWTTPGWVTWFTQIGVSGTTSSSDFAKTVKLVSKYTGTGTDAGKVNVRITGTGLTSCTLSTDQLIVGKTTRAGGIANGSTLTLAGSNTNQNYIGNNWTLALGGQDISGSYFYGAKSVTGIASGTTDCTFENCDFGAATLPPGKYINCGFGLASGTFTAASAGQYILRTCYSCVPGSGTPVFDWATGTGTIQINGRGWHGGSSHTIDGDNTISWEVNGGGGQTFAGGGTVELRGVFRAATFTGHAAGKTSQIVALCGPIAINGTGGTVNVFGNTGTITDNSSGSVTITSTQAMNLTNVNAEVDTALNTAIPGSPTADSINERVATMDGRILGTIQAGTHVAQSGDSFARIGAAGASLTAVPWNAAWDAEVESEATDALTAFTGDTGITLAKALEILAAFIAGKVTASSAGGVTTYTYKKRDGSTTSFTAACSETDGTRATTGSLS